MVKISQAFENIRDKQNFKIPKIVVSIPENFRNGFTNFNRTFKTVLIL